MTRKRYIRLLAGLVGDVAKNMEEQSQLLEISDPDAEETDVEEVLRFTGRLRERLLWIERAAHNIN